MPSSATRSGTPATKRRSFSSLSSKLPKSLRSMEKNDETDQSPGGFAFAKAERRTWDKSPFTQQGKADAPSCQRPQQDFRTTSNRGWTNISLIHHCPDNATASRPHGVTA